MSSAEQIIQKHDEQCKGALTALKRDFGKVRTGRASAGLLEGIHAEYYGSKTPLNKLGQISTPEARLIVIQVFDAAAAPAIEKAIQAAGLGLNPAREGNVIRINIPPLTEESRREILRHLSKIAEDIRVSIRAHRRDANDAVKKLEKDAGLTKDDSKKAQDKIQKQTDGYIQQVDTAVSQKEKEIMEV